jgi:hypothetical protein
VTEGVRAALGEQQPRVDDGPQGALQRGFVHLGDCFEQVVAGLRTNRRGGRQHTSFGVAEFCDVGGDQIGQHRWDLLTGEVCSDELVGEERVAPTTRHHLVHQRAGCAVAHQRADACCHRVPVQAVQVDPMRCGEPAQLGDAGPLRRMTSDFVGPVGADQDQVLVDQVASEVLEEVPGHGVSPVQILDSGDDDLAARVVAEPGEQLEHCGEQAGIGRALGVEGGRACREPLVQPGRLVQHGRPSPSELAEQVGERRQWDGVAAEV